MTELERLSPNRSSRGTHKVDCVIVHDTVSRTAASALDWTGRPEAGVSYHAIIDRSGAVYRCVPDEEKAWHAGSSELFGRSIGGSLNAVSLGVALVDHDGIEKLAYAPEQMEALVDWVAGACARYRIPLNRVVGHEHVSPGRKIDPGPDFDWYEFLAAVAARRGDANCALATERV